MVDLKSLPTGPVVLTDHGRQHLQSRLFTLVERQRHLADTPALTGASPGEDHVDIDAEVKRLRSVLERAVSPTAISDDPRIIELGDAVTIEHDDGEIERVVLTNPVEAVAADHHVSARSPLGLALLGRRAGDRVKVRAPQGDYSCTIVERSRAT